MHRSSVFSLVFTWVSHGRRRAILADFPVMQNAADSGTRPAPTEQPAREAETRLSAHSEARPVEIGGRSGPEPTRYGDWEKNGRCIDF
jgi:hypothetical protein